MIEGPAYRLETERLVLRCFEPPDAAPLSAAIAESLAHLAPFMPWAVHEPLTFGARLEWVRTQRGHFDLGADYCFAVLQRQSAAFMGVGLLRMTFEPAERELGYWVHARHVNQGYACELAAALVRVAFEVEGLQSVVVRTLAENGASVRIAEKLGFLGPELEPLSIHAADGEKRDALVFHLPRVAYAQSPARARSLAAFDVLGRPLGLAQP